MFLPNLRLWGRIALFALVGAMLASGNASAKNIMVFAPHPDDEILMTAGIIADGISRADTVTIVVMTNGDFRGVTMGYTRQQESIAALAYLGLNDQKVVFLGYGDGHTLDIYSSTSDTAVFTSPAGQTQTYGDQGLGHMDYHRYRTGSSASYTKANIRSDVEAILQAVHPRDVYITSIYDDHPDHRATGSFVTDAVAKLRRLGTGSVQRIHEGIVHAPCEYCDSNYHWPMPSFTPTTLYSKPPYLDSYTPLVWTQAENIPVPPAMQSTSTSTNTKYQAISRHATQASDFLYAFVKANEFFWVDDVLNNIALTATATASSSFTPSDAPAAIDGFVDGDTRDRGKEWASQGEPNANLTLTWGSPVSVARVTLHDRTNTTDNVTSGTLSFSDGSNIAVGALPEGGQPLSFTFSPKSVTWVRFTVNGYQGTAPGLAEIEVFTPAGAAPPNNAPAITSGPTATPSQINDAQTSTLSVNVTDADGDPLTYVWSSSGGTISGSGPSVTFTPPTVLSTTTYSIHVVVRDPNDGSTFGNTTVLVSPSAINFALSSSVTVSSENAGTGQFGIKAIDGVIDGYQGAQGDVTKEWATVNETAGAFIRLAWSQPPMVGTIALYDRPNLNEHITAGTLTFSDGTSIPVGSLPNDGTGLAVSFSPKQISWVQFRVDAATGQNIGLAELQAFGSDPDPNNRAPQIASGPIANPTSINDGQTSALTVSATDPDGDFLTYSWGSSGGSVSGNGTNAIFSPPIVSAVTSFTVSVSVFDGRGGSASGYTSVSVTPASNLAFSSSVTVSSENAGTGQFGIKAIDGFIDGYPSGDYGHEWATLGELVGAWIRLTWAQPRSVISVKLYDRPNLNDHIQSGTLTFSDGSSVPVGSLPNDGTGLLVTFPIKQITWVQLSADAAVGQNIGLAEFQVFGPTNAAPQITAGPTASPDSISDLQTSTISATASDPDGDPLTYAWTAGGGSITGSGASVTFTPPAVATTTTISISLTVSDGKGGTATGGTPVKVSRQHNAAPQITAGPSASPDSVTDIQTSTLSVTATDPDGDALIYTWTPSGGAISGSGASATFTPPAVASTTTFTIALGISDGHGGTATGGTSVKVSRHNTAPQITAGPSASPDSITDVLTSTLSVTATDANGDALTYAWTPSGGTISGTGASVTFTPPAVVSTTTFTIALTVDDAHGGTATGNTSVKVTRHNTAPQITAGPAASPDSITDIQTSTLSVTATDAEGDALTYSWTPSGGTISGTGASVTFTPPAVVSTSTFTISLTVDDGHSGTATGNTSVKVTRHNTAPQITAGPSANPDSITDTQTSALSATASDADSDVLTYTWTPSGGSITGSGASVTFTPPTVATAAVFSISLAVDDGRGGTANGATTVKVWRHNRAPQILVGPTAVPDSITDTQSSTIAATATDADGDPVDYTWTASGGTITGSGASVTFTPPPVATTTVFSISLAVSDGLGGAADGGTSVKVTKHNTPPQITAGPTALPDSITDLQTSTITAIATDIDGDPLTYTWTPSGGTISGTGASVTFTPPLITTTTVFTISLAVSDGRGGMTNGATSVKVTRQHNTAPQITAGPAASPDSITDIQTSTLSVTATDAEGDALTYGWTPSGGTISGSGASVTFTPPAVLSTTTFTIALTVDDAHGGTATGNTSVKVTRHNTAPQITAGPTASPDSITDIQTSTLSVTATDAEGDPLTYGWTPSGGSITGAGASVTFTPPAVLSTTTFTIALTVDDAHGGTATGNTSVKVTRHNTEPQFTSGPAASPDSITDMQTSTLSVTATDPEGDALTYSWTPSGGSITGSGASVTFTPPRVPTVTTFTFSIAVTDGHGGTTTGNTSVKVSRQHNAPPQIMTAPAASPDSITDLQTSAITAGATDADGDALTYSWTASRGTFSGSGSSITFTPAAVDTPTDVTISLAVGDGHGGTTTGHVMVNVRREHNTAPQLASGPIANPNSINSMQSCMITVDATDADAESVLFYAWTASAGTLTGGGATVSFKPPDVTAPTPFTVSVLVTDPMGATVSGDVVVNVSQAPVTGVGDTGGELVTGFRLRSANPIHDRAEFAFTVAREGHVSAIVYDFHGRVVAVIVDERAPRGVRALHWDGRTVSGQRAASGTYFVRAQLDGRTITTTRLTILR